MRTDARPRVDAIARPTEEDLPPRRRPARVVLLTTLGGLVVFLVIQAVLAASNAGVVQDAIERGWLEASPFDLRTWSSRFQSAALEGAIAYLILALAGSAIAGRGHRILFALPATAFVLIPLVPIPHQPQAIGPEWAIPCFAPTTCSWPWFAHPWVGALIDLGLVLLPGVLVARSVPAQRWPGRVDAPVFAAIVTAAAAAGAAWWALSAIEPYVDPATLGTVLVFGLVLGTARPWWPWLHVIYAAFAAGSFWLLIEFGAWSDPTFTALDALPYELEHLWPIVTICLLASAWQPLASGLRRLQERPFALAIGVNALNVLDAVLTALAVESGGAYEANPVVRIVGLPMKIVLVAGLTWFVYRRKPSALIWPFAILLWVAAYHVAGILVNG